MCVHVADLNVPLKKNYMNIGKHHIMKKKMQKGYLNYTIHLLFKSRDIICDDCGMKFKSKKFRRTHWKRVHREKYLEKKVTSC